MAPARRQQVRATGPSGAAPSAVRSVPASAAAPAPAPAPAVSPPQDLSERHYQRALALVKSRRFREALKDMESFLQTYPDEERADRAQFWKAEMLFALADPGTPAATIALFIFFR